MPELKRQITSNPPAQSPAPDFPCYEGHSDMKPSERFKSFARALFAVPKAELDELLAADAPNMKRDGTPKRKPGPPPGTPNWRTKQKELGAPHGPSSI